MLVLQHLGSESNYTWSWSGPKYSWRGLLQNFMEWKRIGYSDSQYTAWELHTSDEMVRWACVSVCIYTRTSWEYRELNRMLWLFIGRQYPGFSGPYIAQWLFESILLDSCYQISSMTIGTQDFTYLAVSGLLQATDSWLSGSTHRKPWSRPSKTAQLKYRQKLSEHW